MAEPSFFPIATSLSFSEVASLSGVALPEGVDPERRVEGIAPLETAGGGDAAYMDNPKYVAALAATSAGLCFVSPRFAERVPAGTVALVAPTDLVMTTGDTRIIDGLEFVFQMAPESEAPAEFHFYLPQLKVLNMAENATHNFHNLLPFRGSEVRNALAWSGYLSEALQMWGDDAEMLVGQHHWPVWGKTRVQTHLKQQRDLYKFAHDQTLRMINHGMTAS